MRQHQLEPFPRVDALLQRNFDDAIQLFVWCVECLDCRSHWRAVSDRPKIRPSPWNLAIAKKQRSNLARRLSERPLVSCALVLRHVVDGTNLHQGQPERVTLL